MAFFEPLQWVEWASRAPTVGHAWQQVVGHLAKVGLGDATFFFGQPTTTKGNLAPRHKFGAFVDEEWDRRVHTDPKIAMGDPIARRFLASEQRLQMLRGDDLFRSLTEEEQAFYRHYDEHDVRAGAVWPLHDRKSGTVHAIATWTKLPARDYLRSLKQFGAEIHLATAFFCEALHVRDLVDLKPGFSLSPRERECLLWVQTGRSTKQIADLLKLSDATVNEYVGSAMRKLDASNRSQAAARATILGMIAP